MSSEEEAVPRYVNYDEEHSHNAALNAYISNHRGPLDPYSSLTDSSSMHDDVSSIGSYNDDKDDMKQSLNIFNPRSHSHSQSPFNTKDDHSSNNTERHALLQKDASKELHGRLLREKVMRNHKYYYFALKPVHIWSIVTITTLNHLLRKFYEYFSYFLCMQFFALSFYSMVWSVAALDFAAILSASLIAPFIIDKSPHFIQFCCQIFIGMTTLMMVWWHSTYGLFLLRFVFGIGYNVLLSNWSLCISTFVSPSKQSSAIGRIDLSWSFASFFFILAAYIMDNYGLKYIFYILSICALIASFLLFSIMPSQKLIR